MIQPSPFPPIFTLERVTPTVEAALGKAMLARARMEKQVAKEPFFTGYRISKEATLPALRVIARGGRYSSDVARAINISVPTASARLGALREQGLIECIRPDGASKRGQRYRYSLTTEGRKALEAME